MLALDVLQVHASESGDLLSASDIYLIAKQGLGRNATFVRSRVYQNQNTVQLEATTFLFPDGEEPIRVEVLDSDGLTGDDVLARYCIALGADDEEAEEEIRDGTTTLTYRLRRVEVLPRRSAAYLRSVERAAKSFATLLR